ISQITKTTSNGKGNGHLVEEQLVPLMKNSKEKLLDTATLKSDFIDADLDKLDKRELLRILSEVRNGNFSVRMPIDQVGVTGKICDTLNDIISMNEKMMHEFTRAGNTIGKQGKL